jgi:single-strand DNA-binding protein
MDLNKIQIIGRLAADPAAGVTPQKTPRTTFRMAVNRGKDQVDWYSVVAFGRVAEVVAKYVRKGDRMYVDGTIQTSKGVEIVAQNVIMLGAGKKEPTNDDVVDEEIDVNGAGV